jgi:hypothetical protein
VTFFPFIQTAVLGSAMRKLHVTRRGSGAALVGARRAGAWRGPARAGGADESAAYAEARGGVSAVQGRQAIPAIYHYRKVKALRTARRTVFIEGARRLPEFSYEHGPVQRRRRYFVRDRWRTRRARKKIASHVAPASLDRAIVAGWSRRSGGRRPPAAKLPFECRVTRQQGRIGSRLKPRAGGIVPGTGAWVPT